MTDSRALPPKLNDWLANDVQSFFQSKPFLREYAIIFAGMKGKDLASYSKETFSSLIAKPGLGNACFDLLQEYKEQAPTTAYPNLTKYRQNPTEINKSERNAAIIEAWKESELKGKGTYTQYLHFLSNAPFSSRQKSDSELKQPKNLFVNSEFPTIEREDSLEVVFRHLKERMTLRNEKNKDPREVNPLLAVQSAPGGGKTTFLNYLANNLSGKDEFYPILVTLSNGTAVNTAYDSTPGGLALRIFCTFYFEDPVLSWNELCPILGNQLALTEVIHCIADSIDAGMCF